MYWLFWSCLAAITWLIHEQLQSKKQGACVRQRCRWWWRRQYFGFFFFCLVLCPQSDDAEAECVCVAMAVAATLTALMNAIDSRPDWQRPPAPFQPLISPQSHEGYLPPPHKLSYAWPAPHYPAALVMVWAAPQVASGGHCGKDETIVTL